MTKSAYWRCEKCGHVLGMWTMLDVGGHEERRMELKHACYQLSHRAAYVECGQCHSMNVWRLDKSLEVR